MDERHHLDALHLRGWSQAAIARALGRSPGTISRELARYRPPPAPGGVGGMTCYLPGEAQRQSHARRAAANATRVKIADNPLGDYVRAKLTDCWSPQQIAGRLALDHPDDPTMRISHEAVYHWVYRQAATGERWHRQLRRGRKRRRPRIPLRIKGIPRFAGSRSIDQRPPEVDTRRQAGHWESDTVHGGRGCRSVLATHVERVTRLTRIRKLPDATARSFNRHSRAALADIPAAYRRTLTADNGSEFARFDRLEKRLGLTVYFAQPYKAWQRGANENTNGLIRQFFPKGTNLDKASASQVARVEHLLNNRPRKCLNYRTPNEAFNALPGVALRN